MSVIRTRRWVAASVAVIATSSFAVPAALADTAVNEANQAVQTEGLDPSVGNLPVARTDGSVGVKTKGISLAVPMGTVRNTSTETVVQGKGSSQIIFQDIANGGYRALIHIAKPSDPERYAFNVKGATSLKLADDGSIVAKGVDGDIAYIQPPWAKDRNGLPVPTHYEIVDDTTIVQVVKHQGGQFTYGITADPAWWQTGIHLLKVCLGISVAGELGLRQLFPDVKSVAKFVIRRLGWFAAVSCGGGLLYEALK